MKKIYFYLTLILLFFTLFANAQVVENTDTTDVGVEINGVVWATRNVAEPKKFAENPEGMGLIYQYNRKVGWNYVFSPYDLLGTDGSTVWNTTPSYSSVWEAENDPCPNGWRVPKPAEFHSLIDAGYYTVYGNSTGTWWAEYNVYGSSVYGETENTIYLSLIGEAGYGSGTSVPNSILGNFYWCNEASYQNPDLDIFLCYTLGNSNIYYRESAMGEGYATMGCLVRCVKYITDEEITGITLNKSSITLAVGDTVQLIASVLPASANQNVLWGSSFVGVNVSQSGLVTAIYPCSPIQIFATTHDGMHTAICEVIVTYDAGIDETDISSIIVTPNPAIDELRIENGELIINFVQVTDLTGKIVLNSTLIENSIDVSALPKGIYFIQIRTDKGIKTQKFIKK